MLSREWRCSWSSADRRCSNYIWVINNFIACWGAPYIRYLMVLFNSVSVKEVGSLVELLGKCHGILRSCEVDDSFLGAGHHLDFLKQITAMTFIAHHSFKKKKVFHRGLISFIFPYIIDDFYRKFLVLFWAVNITSAGPTCWHNPAMYAGDVVDERFVMLTDLLRPPPAGGVPCGNTTRCEKVKLGYKTLALL